MRRCRLQRCSKGHLRQRVYATQGLLLGKVVLLLDIDKDHTKLKTGGFKEEMITDGENV